MKVRAQYDKNDVVKDVVKETQTGIIQLIKNDNRITIPQMAQQLNISHRQVQRLLKSLTDIDVIARNGGRKQGYWEIISK